MPSAQWERLWCGVFFSDLLHYSVFLWQLLDIFYMVLDPSRLGKICYASCTKISSFDFYYILSLGTGLNTFIYPQCSRTWKVRDLNSQACKMPVVVMTT